MRHIRHHKKGYYVNDHKEMFDDTKGKMDKMTDDMYSEKFLEDVGFVKYECTDKFYETIHSILYQSKSEDREYAIAVELMRNRDNLEN